MALRSSCARLVGPVSCRSAAHAQHHLRSSAREARRKAPPPPAEMRHEGRILYAGAARGRVRGARRSIGTARVICRPERALLVFVLSGLRPRTGR